MGNKKHNWTWFFRYCNDNNLQLLLNFKKHLLVKELSDKSIHEYLKEMSNFMIYLQEKNVETLEATANDIGEYLSGMDISEARKSRILSVLSVFYKHQRKKRYTKENCVEEYRKSNK